MRRRSFLAAVVALPAALKAVATIEAKPRARPRAKTRKGLPTVQWRALNTQEQMIEALKQTNEILMEMPWRE